MFYKVDSETTYEKMGGGEERKEGEGVEGERERDSRLSCLLMV